MSWLFIAGGAPGLFIIVFGVIALGAAIAFAAKPNQRSLDALRLLSRAVLFSIGAGVASDLATVFLHFSEGELPAQFAQQLLTGLAESMAPAILGFSFLAMVSFLSAVGQRRLVLS